MHRGRQARGAHAASHSASTASPHCPAHHDALPRGVRVDQHMVGRAAAEQAPAVGWGRLFGCGLRRGRGLRGAALLREALQQGLQPRGQRRGDEPLGVHHAAVVLQPPARQLHRGGRRPAATPVPGGVPRGGPVLLHCAQQRASHPASVLCRTGRGPPPRRRSPAPTWPGWSAPRPAAAPPPRRPRTRAPAQLRDPAVGRRLRAWPCGSACCSSQVQVRSGRLLLSLRRPVACAATAQQRSPTCSCASCNN